VLRVLLGSFSILVPFLKGLWRAIRHGFSRPERNSCCIRLPSTSHKRADPMIYDQYWLMSQGLGVTWDNPDIWLFDHNGNLVSGQKLDANSEYKVLVRIWNNSYEGPAPGLPVYLSYLSFRIGLTSNFIGKGFTDLGVKGSAHCPSFAEFIWHTPSTAGHYCLQALLVWADDANPNNNLGQKNTNVGKLHSPAHFDVPVHNDASIPRRFEIEVDTYQLPELPDCSQVTREKYKSRLAESRARWQRTLVQQGYGKFPVTAEWKVTMHPQQFALAAHESTVLSVDIESVSGAFTGRQMFNIHGLAKTPNGQRKLVGGVTLTVEG